MRNLIVVESLADWTFRVPNTEIVLDTEYLTEPTYQESRVFRVYNLCRTYSYQSMGYYVSLLAAARGHRPTPSVPTLLDMKATSILKIRSKTFDALLQRSLRDIRADEFVLSVYFGKNIAKKYQALASELEKLYHTPLLRAKFHKKEKWRIKSLTPISLQDVPVSHRAMMVSAAGEYFAQRRRRRAPLAHARFSLAILVNPSDPQPPSNERALRKFAEAAADLQIQVERVTKDDYARLGEFDGLFIRETTRVDHHTFRFAQKASALGIVVIDDPQSILKCTNKVYLSELLRRHRFGAPRTQVLHRDNLDVLVQGTPLPCILKLPDGAFSRGVRKVETVDEFYGAARSMLAESDVILIQEYLPTPFDWRVGVLGGEILYVAKYYMARGHWQICKTHQSGRVVDGAVESVAPRRAPRRLLETALKASALIGEGLYGLDIKEHQGQYYVIEINDNPNIDAGSEDQTLKDHLYHKVMEFFLRRMTQRSVGMMTEVHHDDAASL